MMAIGKQGEVTIEFDGRREIRTLSGEELSRVRLAYAQHIRRAQGATVTRTLVITGGWQTSKEAAYVEASRARRGTDWFLSREELGVEGQDVDRVERLAQAMRRSGAQTPSLAHAECPAPARYRTSPTRSSTCVDTCSIVQLLASAIRERSAPERSQ